MITHYVRVSNHANYPDVVISKALLDDLNVAVHVRKLNWVVVEDAKDSEEASAKAREYRDCMDALAR